MTSAEPKSNARTILIGLDSEYSVDLRRDDDCPRGNIVSPTACAAYSLRLMQITFAPSQLGLGAFAIFNVSIYPVPFDDISILVVQGVSAEQKPAILSVEAAQSRF